jgi:hypothetical protein
MVKQDGNLVYTDNPEKANLGLLALNPPAHGWSLDLIQGRAAPDIQGWYSPSFNVRLPATCASFRSSLHGPSSITWLIWIVPTGQNVESAQPVVQKSLLQLIGMEGN